MNSEIEQELRVENRRLTDAEELLVSGTVAAENDLKDASVTLAYTIAALDQTNLMEGLVEKLRGIQCNVSDARKNLFYALSKGGYK